MNAATDTADRISFVIDRLQERFRGTVSAEQVAAIVSDEYSRLARSARIRDFLPLQTYRAAADRVTAQIADTFIASAMRA